jgi:pre-60S factor REI1
MVDTNQCKLQYDDNEDEYAEFYDYSKQEEEDASGEAGTSGKELIAGDGAGGGVVALAGYELLLDGGNGGGKVLGSREFSKYYKQRPRPLETRESVMVNTVLAKYRALGIETRGAGVGVEQGLKRAQQKEQQRDGRGRLNLAMRTNINRNLPKNVTF